MFDFHECMFSFFSLFVVFLPHYITGVFIRHFLGFSEIHPVSPAWQFQQSQSSSTVNWILISKAYGHTWEWGVEGGRAGGHRVGFKFFERTFCL